MATGAELIAAGRTIDETRDAIGATSLAFLSLDGLQAATRRPETTFCRACLTRRYPTRVPEGLALAKHRFELARS
jgi:amidophosphoribosyltransferase